MGNEEDFNETQEYISHLCDAIKVLLIAKNKRYGNSALEPANIFSKLSAQDSIKIRLDDKLKRIMNNTDPHPRVNDLTDLVGYLVLLLVAIKADPQAILDLID